MTPAAAVTERPVRRHLVAHSPGAVTVIPLSDDEQLNALLRRVAERGAFVFEQRPIEEPDA